MECLTLLLRRKLKEGRSPELKATASYHTRIGATKIASIEKVVAAVLGLSDGKFTMRAFQVGNWGHLFVWKGCDEDRVRELVSAIPDRKHREPRVEKFVWSVTRPPAPDLSALPPDKRVRSRCPFCLVEGDCRLIVSSSNRPYLVCPSCGRSHD